MAQIAARPAMGWMKKQGDATLTMPSPGVMGRRPWAKVHRSLWRMAFYSFWKVPRRNKMDRALSLALFAGFDQYGCLEQRFRAFATA